jgi:putative Ca2+/H+ antiporter (TMEM165/GDT1 family)
MDLSPALKAFAAVFPAELPDKTMIATIVLVTRYQRPLPVWCGAAAAFSVHVVVAVAAGGLLTLLPETAVKSATAALFAVGSAVLWRSASGHEEDDELAAVGSVVRTTATPAAAFAGSFGVVVLAEWGDLTQFATAGVAASTGAPVAVAIGALLALWSVAGLAVTVGRTLAHRLPIHALQRGAAVVFAVLALSVLWSVRS